MVKITSFILVLFLCVPAPAFAVSKNNRRSQSIGENHGVLSSSGIDHMQQRLLQYMALKVGGIGSAPDGAAVTATKGWGTIAELTVAALADTTEPEKERVKKKDKKERTASTTKDEKSSSSCFGDCLGGFFGAMFFSGDDDDELAPEGYTETPGMGPTFSEPYDAMLSLRDPQGGAVTVWDNPGGRESDATIVGSLTTGAEVTVTDRAMVGETPWLRIVTRETPATVGWIAESTVITTPVASEPAVVTGERPAEEPHLEVGWQKWALLLDLGVPVFTEGQINDEYLDKAFSLSLGMRLFMLHGFQVNGGATYLHANGEPKYDFVVGAATESPSDSRLNIWCLSVGLGQLYQVFGPQGFIVWEAAPAVFHVSESADITVIENKVVTATRKDELSEWMGGFRAKLEGGGMAGSFPIGVYVTYSVFPWHSNNQKSLTFDFLEKNHVVIFGFGVTVGASFF